MASKAISISKIIQIYFDIHMYIVLYLDYIKVEFHVLSSFGTSIEAVWCYIDTLATTHLVWVCTRATRLLQITFKRQASQTIGTQKKIKWFSTATIFCPILYIILFRILSINSPWDTLSCDPSLAQHVLPMHCFFNHHRVTFQDHASGIALSFLAYSFLFSPNLCT